MDLREYDIEVPEYWCEKCHCSLLYTEFSAKGFPNICKECEKEAPDEGTT